MIDKAATTAPAESSPPKKRFCGVKGKSGPRRGVPQRNGLSTSRLAVGELPKPMIAVKREARAYRRVLESAVMTAKDLDSIEDISIVDKHKIAAATGCTMSIGIDRWVLRNNFDKLHPTDFVAIGRDMRLALKERAAIVMSLGLEAPTLPPWLIEVEAEPATDAPGELEDK